MKVKIPVTEEFLWDLYHLIADSVDAIPEFYPYPTIKTVLIGRNNSLERRYIERLGKRKFGQLIHYLKRRGYIRVKNLEQHQGMLLTKDGMSRVLKASFQRDGKAERKDGKCIMVIFDVPRSQRNARQLLMSTLRNLGYRLYQNSVWVTPYDVYEKTDSAFRLHVLDKYVKIFLIEKL